MYTFDTRALRFRDISSSGRRRGQFVSYATVEANRQALIRAAREAIEAETTRLMDREVSLVAWERAVQRHLKVLYGAQISLASGGMNRMTPDRWGRAGGLLAAQYRYLRRLRHQVETGEQRRDGTLLRRVRAFARSGRGAYFRQEMHEHIETGREEARSITRPGDHCSPKGDRPGCVELEKRGWMPIPEMTPPLSRACYDGCNCYLEYR